MLTNRKDYTENSIGISGRYRPENIKGKNSVRDATTKINSFPSQIPREKLQCTHNDNNNTDKIKKL